jgi:hypothetical protein
MSKLFSTTFMQLLNNGNKRFARQLQNSIKQLKKTHAGTPNVQC